MCGWGSSINRGGSYRTNWSPEKSEDVEYDNGCSHSPARDAIMPATLADSVTIWPALTRIARDQGRTSGTRKQALFWLSAEAGEKVAGPGREDTDEATDIRKQAVFALSQWRNSESVPGLIEVARKNRDPEVRRTALFWLGQKDDPRVIPLFEEILSARE